MSKIFMPAGWISETQKANKISQNGVFAELAAGQPSDVLKCSRNLKGNAAGVR